MKKTYLIGLLWLLLASCSDFLEEYSQDQAYVQSYNDLDELLVGETYMETVFGSDGDAYYPYVHLMADETKENLEPDFHGERDYNEYQKKYFGYVTWQNRVGLTVDRLSTKAEDADWDRLYKHINLANMILYEIEKQHVENDDDRKAISRIRGEAYFLRAAYYFILVNLYGEPYQASIAETALGVPVKTSEAIEDNMFPRETLKTVYDLIISDLELAAKNLEGISRKSIYRANITAVRLLQGRVYLYMQNWEEAAKHAQLCLDLQSELVDLNTFGNSETAFATASSPELIFSMGGNNIPRMLNDQFAGLSASADLIECYTQNDLRRQFFLTEVEYTEYYDCNKYVKQEATNNANVSDNFMFRTAEAWLNLAEAYACMGGENNEQEARTALDRLRQHRIETSHYEATALSGDALIEEIRAERRRELCFEGHRWFDLRRYTVSEKAPFTGSIRNTYSEYDYFWDDWEWKYYWDVSSSSTYELTAGDPAWTLQIPYEVLQFEELTPNPRHERAPISTEN